MSFYIDIVLTRALPRPQHTEREATEKMCVSGLYYRFFNGEKVIFNIFSPFFRVLVSQNEPVISIITLAVC